MTTIFADEFHPRQSVCILSALIRDFVRTEQKKECQCLYWPYCSSSHFHSLAPAVASAKVLYVLYALIVKGLIVTENHPFG